MSDLDLLTVNAATGEWRRAPLRDRSISSSLLASLLLAAWPADRKLERRATAPVVLAGGGASGHLVVGGATAIVCSRSPQSGGIAESRVEGRLAYALRASGLAAVVLHGVAVQPSVILLDRERPTILPATGLVGLDAATTTHELMRRFPGCLIGAIGVAGERQFSAASIVFDHSFPTATGGLGAALGSLGIKAIVLPLHNASEPRSSQLHRVTAEYVQRIDTNPLTRHQRDLPGFGVWAEPGLEGYLAAMNFSATQSPGVTKELAATVIPYHRDARPGCPGCPQNCLKVYASGDTDAAYGRLHQLALAIWTSQLGMTDVTQGLTFNAACHQYGLEHLSVGAMLGALAECEATGLTTNPRFSFGDARTALALLEEWGQGPQLPWPVPNSIAQFARATGCASAIMAIKDMPMPPLDPRGSQGLAMAMALNPSGPRYDVLEHDIDFDPEHAWPEHVTRAHAYGVPAAGIRMGTLDDVRVASVISLWELWSGLDAFGVCIFAGPPTRELDEDRVVTLIGEASGVEIRFEDVLQRGRQRLAVQRQLNYVWGVGEATERLPPRFHRQPIDSGGLAGKLVRVGEFQRGLTAVRAHFGWGDKFGGAEDRDGLARLVAGVRLALSG
jgi:aldehyde:ferredoxin oxidoreductase